MRTFHAPSLAVGILATALVLVSMSQAVPLLSPPRIQYGPNPNDMITIKEGTPYTVPAGRVLVLTGLGSSWAGQSATLYVDGQIEAFQYFNTYGGNDVSIVPIPTGMTVRAGSVVAVASMVSGQGRALGYLGQP